MPSQQHSYSDHPNDNGNSYGEEGYDCDDEFRPSNNGYDYNNHHGSFEMVSTTTNTTTTNGKKNGILATRKTSTAETLNDSSDDDDDDSENGMQFKYEDDEDYYCDDDGDDDDEDDRRLVHQPQSKNQRRRQYIEEDGDDINNSGDDYHLQSNLLSTLLPKHIYQYLYPPNVPKSIQLYRLENLAIPACYLLVGILQGLSGPFTNVYPLDLNASEAQQVSLEVRPRESYVSRRMALHYYLCVPIIFVSIRSSH